MLNSVPPNAIPIQEETEQQSDVSSADEAAEPIFTVSPPIRDAELAASPQAAESPDCGASANTESARTSGGESTRSTSTVDLNAKISTFMMSEPASDEESTDTKIQKEPKRKPKLLYFIISAVFVLVIVTAVSLVFRSRSNGTSAPSAVPSFSPSAKPSSSPTSDPSSKPSQSPSVSPSHAPTSSPSATPTAKPTTSPAPSSEPSKAPTESPSITPMPTLKPVTYRPGQLTLMELGLLLSEGLRAKIIGRTGNRVQYHNGTSSAAVFHGNPDYGTTFPDERPHNRGGWVYTSNAEMEAKGTGGVGAITFDRNGNVIDYRMVLENTTMNCGGGRTPWNTYVSCEEVEFEGQIYQVDPFGERKGQLMTLGIDYGRWESFAYDVRDKTRPRFFATEDHNKGTVRRFTPDIPDWENPWDMLHSTGVVDYLIVHPNDEKTGGTFEWINDKTRAQNNAKSYYPQTEGIDVYENQMIVVCKNIKQMFTFDLDKMTYTNESTVSGLFDGGPDQMGRLLEDSGELLYFTEEGGKDAGIHARDEQGRFFTILESPQYIDETTGLAFSPDGFHMYVAYQKNGLLFDVWREDGLPFQARTLNVKYHQTGLGT